MEEEQIEGQSDQKVKVKFVARTPMEAQRIKLEKLMSDPNKPVLIPTAKQKKDFSNSIPSFIRNVMGSSAGAGSGEFHVYRHLRRKEYARQKHIQQKSKQETLDDEYQQKLDNNRQMSEEKTAKKRAKRLKKKKNAKNKAKVPKIDGPVEKSETESEDDEDEEVSDTEHKLQTVQTEANAENLTDVNALEKPGDLTDANEPGKADDLTDVGNESEKVDDLSNIAIPSCDEKTFEPNENDKSDLGECKTVSDNSSQNDPK